jgi:acetyl esterase
MKIFIAAFFVIGRVFLLHAPRGFWRLYYIGRSKRIDGRTLDPRAQAYLSFMALLEQPHMPPVQVVRGGYDKLDRMFGGERVQVEEVSKREITINQHPLTIQTYDAQPVDGPKSGLLFFHGGGFVIGSVKSHDGFCRRLARDTGRRVVSVEYRKGPEHKLPSAQEDAVALWDWLVNNAAEEGIDKNDIAVCGDSAGAALTLVVGKHAAQADIQPSALIPIYPPEASMAETNSRKLLLDQNISLTRKVLDWFGMQATDDSTDHADPRYALSSWKLPRTFIITCGFDPLRDEGEAIVQHLLSLGTDVRHEEKPGLFHNYILLGGVFPEVDETTRAIGGFLQS